jgi:hypothetical protein
MSSNCVCTHSGRDHLGGNGRCNEGTKTCRCQIFHIEEKPRPVAPVKVRTVTSGARCETCWGIAVYHSAVFGTTPETEYDHIHSDEHEAVS